MGTVIVVLLIAAAVILAAVSSAKHFRGEGGCCGGASVPKPKKKKLDGQALGRYVLRVEGMTCAHCKAKVEEAVNSLDGAACRVQLKKKQAVIEYDRPLDVEAVLLKIQKAGYSAELLK